MQAYPLEQDRIECFLKAITEYLVSIVPQWNSVNNIDIYPGKSAEDMLPLLPEREEIWNYPAIEQNAVGVIEIRQLLEGEVHVSRDASGVTKGITSHDELGLPAEHTLQKKWS